MIKICLTYFLTNNKFNVLNIKNKIIVFIAKANMPSTIPEVVNPARNDKKLTIANTIFCHTYNVFIKFNVN